MTLASTIACEGCKYFFQGETDRTIHQRHCDNEALIKIMNEYYGIKCGYCEQPFRKWSMVKEHEQTHFQAGEERIEKIK